MCCVCTFQDEEINQQSQLAEKLKQQMLDQEEVSAGGLTGTGNNYMGSMNSQQPHSCEGTPWAVKTAFKFCRRATTPSLSSLFC